MWRDAPRHRSPSAGSQEAALAGPRQYGGAMIEDHWMGDGRADLTPADLRAALRLYLAANALLAAALGLLVVA